MSQTYRRHKDAIWNGRLPGAYERVRKRITGRKVIEIGGAEGVLALLLAKHGHEVICVERHEPNYEQALLLKSYWRAKFGEWAATVTMVHADIRDRLDLMSGCDTLVAKRSIYYLGDDAEQVIKAARDSGITEVVLCCNGRRARDPEDKYHRWASVDWMKHLCTTAGFKVEQVVPDGDPIVVGRCRG